MNTCPAGHETEATDYCDVCGIAMDAAPDGASAPTADAAAKKGKGKACGKAKGKKKGQPKLPIQLPAAPQQISLSLSGTSSRPGIISSSCRGGRRICWAWHRWQAS